MKHFLLISLAALIGLMTYGTSFGAGSSDNDDFSSTEMVDVDYLNGKEEAYNGNYRAAIVYLKKSIENKKKEIDQFIREYGVSTKTYKSIQGMMKYQIYAPVVRPRLKKRRKTMWDEYLMGIGYLSNREWY